MATIISEEEQDVYTLSNPYGLNEIRANEKKTYVYTRREYININSEHRDKTLYPNANTFKIKLNKEYRNIKQIEVIGSDLEYNSNANLRLYFLLTSEIIGTTILDTNVDYVINKIRLKKGKNVIINDGHINGIIKEYETPIPLLQEIDLHVKETDGTLVDVEFLSLVLKIVIYDDHINTSNFSSSRYTVDMS